MQIQRIEISKLTSDPANARKHGDRNIQTIVESLNRFGQQKPIVVDSSNCVRAGNGTLEAARSLGWTHLDCVVTDLKGSDAIAYAIADNRTAELAEWDDGVLVATLEGLQLEGLLASAGFNGEELQSLMDSAEPEPEVFEDEAPGFQSETKSQPGDVWLLGKHRLGCGSCTSQHFVESVFDGELGDMLFTDPPYNVAYEGKTKDKLTIKNDSMSSHGFLEFLQEVFTTLATVIKPGSAAYVCHADSEGRNFRQAFAESGFELKQCLVWVKNTFVMGRQDYQWRHEPILYGWRSGEAHRFYADRKQTTVIDDFEGVTFENADGKQKITIAFNGRTVQILADAATVVYDGGDELDSIWRFNKPSRNGEHPTMKPISLCSRAIRHGSKKGDIVVDGFLGSGSTLIACEQMERRCIGFELDPKYCDVIIKRWENLTGQKAVLHDNAGHKNDGESTRATVADQAGVSRSDNSKADTGRRKPAKQTS